ncbi:HesB/IscA family protein [Oscillatoria salina]|uniref:HesB/IscA family protein n=1 Tax=Oscillatoria salina TaxID=331517 RepID=UPI0013B6A109|nr:iron-sulfur cluster assembly accessory protein [Oscillatoria salina]MBZ8181678.1 iron-sulfur cluster assembly accessory protein [Oscillatoria salina IIICB1]NET90681.1 iron-sulfur cluster assembly accessory protein [Kamptonema sp. SIO1D9]
MTVTLTEKAAFRLRSFVRASADETTEKAVRLAVVDGGCSGYEYVLDITNKRNSDDLVFEQDKVRIYIDPQSAPLLKGVVIDFVDSLLQSGFTFTNPNATDSCGCGKSFSAGDCTPTAVPCS